MTKYKKKRKLAVKNSKSLSTGLKIKSLHFDKLRTYVRPTLNTQKTRSALKLLSILLYTMKIMFTGGCMDKLIFFLIFKKRRYVGV